MAYQLYVTRAAYWAENDERRIELADWHALVKADPALTPDGAAGSHGAEFKSAVADREWIDWRDGNLVSTYPSQDTFAKLLEIAQRFDAQLQGEDGERYLSLADYPVFDRPATAPQLRKAGLPAYLRRDGLVRWTGMLLVVMAVIAANLLDWW